MTEADMTEADVCREFVTPKRVEAGWGAAESVIGGQHSFTNGRIIVAGGKVRRGKRRRAGNLPFYRGDFPLAFVEAKKLGLPAETGVQRAREYAGMLGLKFACATNGQRIIETNYTRRTERDVGLQKIGLASPGTGDRNRELSLGSLGKIEVLVPPSAAQKSPQALQAKIVAFNAIPPSAGPTRHCCL